jgi:hypothetical protein
LFSSSIYDIQKQTFKGVWFISALGTPSAHFKYIKTKQIWKNCLI